MLDPRMRVSTFAHRCCSLLLVPATLACLAAPAQAKPRARFDTSEGFSDPRRPALPRTHRFRFSIESGYIGLTSVTDPSTGLPVQFKFAPLMLGFAYQLQFLKLMSLRVGSNIGYNVVNSRSAMPVIVNPRLWLGVQARRVGVHAGYGYLLIVPGTIDAVSSRSDLEQPLLKQPHQVGGEISFTTRVDKFAFTGSVGIQAVFSRICHLSLDCEAQPEETKRIYPMVTFGLGMFFDGSIKRAKAKAAKEKAKEDP
jgi:hypothetical protein